jgi:hypothetical protein
MRRIRSAVCGTVLVLMLTGAESCGQSQAAPLTSSASTSSLGVFALSDSGCAYQGQQKISTGRGSATLSNKLANQAHFDFWRLNEGHGYSEFVAHVQEEQRRIQAAEPGLGHPTFATLIATETVAPQGTKSLALPSAAGTYAMACIPWRDGPTGIFAAGPLTMSP